MRSTCILSCLLFFCSLSLLNTENSFADTLYFPPAVQCDLDRDGTKDTTIEFRACTQSTAGMCLGITSTVTPSREFNPFPAGSRPRNPGYIPGEDIKCIGDHVGTALSEIAVVYTLPYPAKGCTAADIDRCQYASVMVIDPTSGPVASTWGPASNARAYVAFPAGPGGKRYPTLVPGYGNYKISSGLPNQDPYWDYICRYDPTVLPSAPDPRCSVGFRAALLPTDLADVFREFAGYVQDMDNDGWDDLNLIYHGNVVTLSGKNGQRISQTFLNFSEGQDEPVLAAYTQAHGYQPGYYHSYRLYGKYMVLPSADSPAGTIQTLIVGGVTVGDISFSDPGCNGSRFITLLEAYPGSPGSQHMKYHTYYNWGADEFPSPRDPALVDNPPVLHHGTLHKCIHQPGDSRAVMEGERILVVNMFQQNVVVDPCIKESYASGIAPDPDGSKIRRLYECLPKRTYELGRWQAKIFDEQTGVELKTKDNLYIWGISKNFLPGGEFIYVAEELPATVSYDIRRSTSSQPTMALYRISNGEFVKLQNFPAAGRPEIRYVEPTDSRGSGGSASFGDLSVLDYENDGLEDLRLLNGNVVGYSANSRTLVLKNGVMPKNTPTPTATRTAQATPTRTPTATATRTPARTATPLPTKTSVPLVTPTRTPTRTPTATATATSTTVPQPISPWRNPRDRYDTNNNGALSPIDVLVLINRYNASGGAHVLPPPSAGFAPPPYYDPTGDGQLTMEDIQMVFNELNRRFLRSTAATGTTNLSLLSTQRTGTQKVSKRARQMKDLQRTIKKLRRKAAR